jgi:hypothetical protein
MWPFFTLRGVLMRALSTCVLVLFVCTGVYGQEDRILCQCDDGHSYVEHPQRRCCVDSSSFRESRSSCPSSGAQARKDSTECSRCVDTPLLASTTSVLPGQQTTAPLPSTHSIHWADEITSLACSSPNFRERSAPVTPQSTIQSLRTVVLLV